MKILDNGIVRDMTAEEEAEFLNSGNELSDEEALNIILGGGGDEA